MSAITQEVDKLQLLLGAKFLHAYLECSDDIQAGIREMLAILDDPTASDEDRMMTMVTLADALFPNPHNGQLGLDLEESERMGAEHSAETKAALEELDREEEIFATRLSAAMKAKGFTQEVLAERTGVRQSAISNMLNRRCRPQRRTVIRFAEALDMSPQELWSDIAETVSK